MFNDQYLMHLLSDNVHNLLPRTCDNVLDDIS